jgi:hypothetical protein
MDEVKLYCWKVLCNPDPYTVREVASSVLAILGGPDSDDDGDILNRAECV